MAAALAGWGFRHEPAHGVLAHEPLVVHVYLVAPAEEDGVVDGLGTRVITIDSFQQ